MIRLMGLLLIVLLTWPVLAEPETALLRFKPVLGKLDFHQSKQLQGLPVALQSSGYLLLQEDNLLWHTTAPVDSQLMISSGGVSQWQEQQFIAVAGSEFVGQLMLAVLQQQHQFIAEHFTINAQQDGCIALQPIQAPLNTLFRQISLCGDHSLQRIQLLEMNGNQTDIRLQQEAPVE